LGQCYAANVGNTNAQLNLGWESLSIIQKPFFCYQKAADAGNTKAQFNLGQCYQNRWGVSIDNEKAFHWYQKGADAEDSDGQFNLGLMHKPRNHVFYTKAHQSKIV